MVRVTGLEPASTRHWFLRPACLPFHHIPITSLFYFERPLINFSKTPFCFDLSEAQYEEKPTHGFRILDSQLSMRIISLLTYADIFFSFPKTRVRKHTLRNLPNAICRNVEMVTTPGSPIPPVGIHMPRISNLRSQNASWTGGARTHDPLIASYISYNVANITSSS